ncbi:CLUMA_CG007624, isoform A [Clunio marinus]|uniref:CLUMA_CG007624, isoform A n=1 Tax=Clunio marinus TaxID=568069 RepID=A0A1J1I1E5_9DIPT|nr:CLUMA_CG007624, isoform A [Clunio marinus]
MYRNNKSRRVTKPTTSKPVYVSQKRNELEKENEADIIPSSQDQEIPSSQNQETSQIASQSRFLSQRHQVSRLTQEYQARGKNYFEILLISSKIKITNLGCEFILEGDDPVSFIRRFRSILGFNQSSNSSVCRFVDEFKKTFSLKEDSIKVAQKFLSGLIMKESHRTYTSQTSLIQCFLAVVGLKDEVAKHLLENLKSYVIDRGEHADAFIVGLVIAQFKFSDQLLAPSTYNMMYEKFFEILHDTKSEACRAVIISNFRDLDEFKQDDAVKRLLEMFSGNQELLTPFIETFTEMCISDDTKVRISSLVQNLLENQCSSKLYAGIVKYLLYYMQSPTDIVENLRKYLKWNTNDDESVVMMKKQSSAEDLLLNHKILLRVLDTSKVKLTFNEHRLVMELLSSLAYTTSDNEKRSSLERRKLEEDRAALQEHLEMIVSKLMCNPDMKIKQLGIIGAVKIISSLVVNVSTTKSHKKVTKTHDITIDDDIPKGPIRDAAKRVNFVIESVRGNPHGLAMIYDEMSLEFQSKRCEFEINQIFLTWLSEKLFKELETLTAVDLREELPSSLAHKFMVNVDDFEEPTVGINLGLQVMIEKSENVVVIPSLFKITRLLMQHRFKGLSELYVFAVMPITVTETFATSDDEIDELHEEKTKQQLDLYFHCINWLREIIGTYCHWSQDDKEALSKCVTQRVKQLVMIENKLNKLLVAAPSNYYPPAADFLDIDIKKRAFDCLRKEKKNLHKPLKKSRKKNNNSTIANNSDEQESSIEINNKLRTFCREIDTQVILLLTETFKFSSEDVSEYELGLDELMFLLDDIYYKISSTCNPRSVEQRGFFDPIRTIEELKDAVIPFLVSIFEAIRGEFISMSQNANEEVFYTRDANILKNCFCLVLKIFEVILSCPKLKLQRHNQLLKETLMSLIPDGDESIESQDQLCFLIIEHGTSFERNVKNCNSAVALVTFLRVISRFSSSREQHELVHQLSGDFLKKQWKDSVGDDEQGATFNGNLEKLLQIFVDDANLQRIEELVDKMMNDMKKIFSKQIEYQETFPSFNKKNSLNMLRTYMNRLSKIICDTNPDDLNFKFWLSSAKIFNQLTEICKGISTQNAFVVFLKHFLIFIRLFNKHGIAVLKNVVKNREKFMDLVKTVQNITRFSHFASCDLKHRKNKSVLHIIPKLHEALAKNYQVVCAILPSADIPASSIITGTLKNLDAQGEEILSQNTNATSECDDDDDDDEVMEADEDAVMDDSDDATMDELQENQEDQPRSGSFRSRSTIL